MKRSVILTLCIVLCLALSLGGTIAYLTDSDGDVNVMTLGRVKISLEEYQRDGKGGLEDYTDGRMLLPLVGNITAKDKYGLPENPNFHDKIVRVVSDTSNADAYLRVWIGVPSALLDVVTEKDAVHLVWGEKVSLGAETSNNWVQGEPVSTTIEGIPYTMYCWNYAGLLTSGDVTLPVLAGLYLDEMVDNEDGKYVLWMNGKAYPLDVDLSEGLQIPVLAQAVQAAGFATADQAFAAADMDDSALFDAYLELKTPAEKLAEEVKWLIAQMVEALEVTTEGNYKVQLNSATYDINGAAADEMNETASDTNKKVRLIVAPEKTVEINLYAELEDNIVIVNEGGNLTINGKE